MEWFLSLDITVQAAIIGGVATVCAAIITGLFAVGTTRKQHKDSDDAGNCATTITQSSSGHHNVFIGIQNDRKNEVQ